MLYTKIQPQSFLCSGEKDIKSFYHILAGQPSCSKVQNHLTSYQYLFDRRPCVKSGDNWVSSFREKRLLKITQFYTCI